MNRPLVLTDDLSRRSDRGVNPETPGVPIPPFWEVETLASMERQALAEANARMEHASWCEWVWMSSDSPNVRRAVDTAVAKLNTALWYRHRISWRKANG